MDSRESDDATEISAHISQANRNEGRVKVGISVEDIVMSVAQTPHCFQSEREECSRITPCNYLVGHCQA